MFASGKTARELSTIFGVSQFVILNKSKQDNWGELRKKVREAPPAKPFAGPENMPKRPRGRLSKADEILFQSKTLVQKENSENNEILRAARIRSSDEFRNRVIVQLNKALSTLEKAIVNNVFETDRFAEALTKVERIGARAYGYV
jgi:hypothetical protein